MDPSPDSRWQDTFDTDFPHGLIMRWDDDPDTNYLIPRIEVMGVPERDQPVVRLDTYDAHKSFVTRITGYTVIRRNPTLARVVTDNFDRLLIWDGNLPQPLIDAMSRHIW